MKNFVFFVLGCCVFTLASCSRENLEPEMPQTSTTVSAERYDEDVKNLAIAVNKAINENPSFRRFIKDEVMKQLDGDYDMILSTVLDKSISTGDLKMTRAGADEMSFKEMLSLYYEGRPTTKSSGNAIEDLVNEYPDLQISVPIHAEDWDAETQVLDIAIMPSDYEDLVTETVPGIDSEGNPIIVDAINEPDKPYLVIGPGERVDTSRYHIGPTLPPYELGPYELPVSATHKLEISLKYEKKSVRLEADLQPIIYLDINKGKYVISSFDIYRTSDESDTYTLIARGLSGGSAYIDNTVDPDCTYRYKVVAQASKGTRVGSCTGYASIITNDDVPMPVSDFVATSISSGRNKLTWTNDNTEYYKTVIYRTTPTETRKLIATLDPLTDFYYDSNLTPGEKWTYEIRKVNENNGYESVAQYTYVYNPYRNPEGVSRVMLRKIHVNAGEVEGWMAGKPEFYITVYGLDTDKNVTKLGGTIDVKFSEDLDDSQDLNGLLHNWSYFNDMLYYPAINFHMIEYDQPTFNIDVTVTAKAGIKLMDYISLDAVGSLTFELKNRGRDCGCASILYFENPEQTIQLQSYGASLTISE